jgi:hypothetical protein
MFAAGNRPLFEIGQAIVARYAGEIMIRELCASDLKDIVLRRKPPERSTGIARVGA